MNVQFDRTQLRKYRNFYSTFSFPVQNINEQAGVATTGMMRLKTVTTGGLL